MAVHGRSYHGWVPAVSWPGTGRILGSRLSCRSPRSRALRCAARLRPAVSRAYPAPCRRLPLGRVMACMAVSEAQGRAPGWPCPGLAVLYFNTAQPFLLKSVTIQFLYCDTSLLSPQARLSHNCIAIQLSSHPTYCNTPLNPAIQFLPHNTYWAVAHSKSAPDLFLFFLINIFFFFHYFQQLEKS